MHPVLGTMMPEICEAPHFPIYLFHPSFGSVFNEWDAFITFLPLLWLQWPDIVRSVTVHIHYEPEMPVAGQR